MCVVRKAIILVTNKHLMVLYHEHEPICHAMAFWPSQVQHVTRFP